MKMEKFDTVDDYIASFPKETQIFLKEFRKVISKQAPNGAESMSYGMPGYKLNGKPLAYFAAFKNHISFFPTPSGINALEKETTPYKTGKGTLQFSYDKPIPWDLVERILKLRIGELSKKN